MFNDSIPALKSREEEEKALQETILRVKQNSIAWQTEHMDPGDMNALQEIVRKAQGNREIAYFFGLRIKYEQLWKEEPIWKKM